MLPPYEPAPETLTAFIDNQWADMHHSRVQEWSALGVVTGAHLAILQLPKALSDMGLGVPVGSLVIAGSVAGIAFALVGGLVTLRHRRAMENKLGWIHEAQTLLGLVRSENHPIGVIDDNALMVSRPIGHTGSSTPVEGTAGPSEVPTEDAEPQTPDGRGLSWPRPLSTSWLILMFYVILVVYDMSVPLLLIGRR